MNGTWLGTYTYEGKRIPDEMRSQITKFRIKINGFDGVCFSGIVEDDLDSGGTRGVGKVTGKLINKKVSFVKEMPVKSYVLPDGSVGEENTPHRKIYYSGVLKGDSIKGVWKFKFGVGRVGNRLSLFLPIKGLWEMKREHS